MTTTQQPSTYDKLVSGTGTELRKYQRWGIYLLSQKITELEESIRLSGGTVPTENIETTAPNWILEGGT